MTQVLKISKPGKDAISDNNAYDMVLTTQYPTYKVFSEGSHTFVMNSGQFEAYYSVMHNLGYVPMVFGWLERSGKTYNCNGNTGISDVLVGGIPAIVQAICLADTTTASIGAFNVEPVNGPADANYTFTAHWKIMIDQY